MTDLHILQDILIIKSLPQRYRTCRTVLDLIFISFSQYIPPVQVFEFPADTYPALGWIFILAKPQVKFLFLKSINCHFHAFPNQLSICIGNISRGRRCLAADQLAYRKSSLCPAMTSTWFVQMLLFPLIFFSGFLCNACKFSLGCIEKKKSNTIGFTFQPFVL